MSNLPDVEVYVRTCPTCGGEVRLLRPFFCAGCYEEALERLAKLRARRAAAQVEAKALLDQAKRRARTWQLGRAVRA